MKTPQEKIFDSLLDEVLNDARPQIRAEDILRKLEAVQSGSKQQTNSDAFVGLDDSALATGTNPNSPVVPTSRPSRPAQKQNHPKTASEKPGSLPWASVLAGVAALLVLGATIWWALQPVNQPIADNNEKVQPAPPIQPKLVESNRDKDRLNQPERVRPTQPEFPAQPKDGIAGNNTGNDEMPSGNRRDDVPENKNEQIFPAKFKRAASVTQVAARANQLPNETAAAINEQLRSLWGEEKIQSADRLSAGQWVTRLCNRVVGRAPTADEQESINKRIADRGDSPELRMELVEYLSTDPAFRESYLDHWSKTLAWKWIGLSPTMSTEDKDIKRLQSLIREQIAANKPMDELVYRLVSVVGSNVEGDENFDPATSYFVSVLKRFGGNPALSRAHVSQSLLGNNNKCAQCHNSPTDSSQTQLAYWEFQSFFAQTSFEPIESESGNWQFYIANRNFLPQGREGKTEAPLTYVDPQQEKHTALPKFNDVELGPNGFVAKVDRRTELANVIASSKQFREATINLVWTSLLNVPLTGIEVDETQVDPQIIKIRDSLVEQFVANEFDLNWLVSSIALSDAFAVGVGTEEQIAGDNPYLGSPPKFSRFYHRYANQRSADLSLAIVARAYESGAVEEAASAGLLARVAGDSKPSIETKLIQPYLPSNDNQWATSSRVSKQLDMISESKLSARQKVEHVILAALGRLGTESEIKHGEVILGAGQDQRIALQDIWWGLLNSVEYELPLIVR